MKQKIYIYMYAFERIPNTCYVNFSATLCIVYPLFLL